LEAQDDVSTNEKKMKSVMALHNRSYSVLLIGALDFRKVWAGSVDWLGIESDCSFFVNTVMNLQSDIMAGNFFTS
jgi:hypothetical protein